MSRQSEPVRLSRAVTVEEAMQLAADMLRRAAEDGPRHGRSQRWRASVERLALQVDGLRTGEGA